MAQRARRKLTSVEPRSTPLFATSAAEFAGALAGNPNPDSVFEKSADGESFDSGMDEFLPRHEQHPPLQNDGQRRKNHSAAGARRSPVRQRLAGEPGLEGDDDQRAVSEHQPHRPAAQAAQAPPRSDGNVAFTQPPVSLESLPSEREVSPLRQPLSHANDRSPPDRTGSREPPAASPLAAIFIERGAPQLVDGAGRTELDSGDDADTRPRSAAGSRERRQPQEDRVVAPQSGRAATLEGSGDPRSEPRTEIHISIGSVELRAPRLEARRQPAPFRPRVTLDDFLGRRR